MSLIQTVVSFVVLFCWLCFGGLLFYSIEDIPEEERWNSILSLYHNMTSSNCINMDMVVYLLSLSVNSHQLESLKTYNSTKEADIGEWDFFTSLFFSLVVSSTVGFGSQSPATKYGQLACVLYAIVGIPIFLNAINQLTNEAKQFIFSIEERLPKKLQKHHLIITILFMICLFFFIYVIPCFIISELENWSFHTALYFGFVTLSTIGFGDFVPGNRPDRPKWYKVFLGVWMFIGLTYVAVLISFMQISLDKLVNHCFSRKERDSKENPEKPRHFKTAVRRLRKQRVVSVNLANSNGSKIYQKE